MERMKVKLKECLFGCRLQDCFPLQVGTSWPLYIFGRDSSSTSTSSIFIPSLTGHRLSLRRPLQTPSHPEAVFAMSPSFQLDRGSES